MKFTIEEFDIPDVIAITPERIGDERGFFSEVYSKADLRKAGINTSFVQDNHSFSALKGIIRGLHFQIPPFAQGRIVRVVRGQVLDVAVDLRYGSPTFGRHVAITLSADNWKQLWIPEGFAHGFCTLTENVELLYKVTTPYSADHDRGLAYDDALLGIAWPVRGADAVLSHKDKKNPPLSSLPQHFIY